MSSLPASVFLSNLVYVIPTLLVCGVAFCLALKFEDQAPLAAKLTMAGAVFLALTPLVHAALMMAAVQEEQARPVGTGALLLGINILSTAGRTIGLALLVAAIFVDRHPPMTDRNR